MTQLIQPNKRISVGKTDLDVYIAQPKEGPRNVAVLMFIELWGLSLHMKEVADRLAQQGYTAVVCDLFTDSEPPKPEDPKEKWAECFNNFDDLQRTKDCRAAVAWLDSDECPFDVNHVFAWGFCMGGRFAHNLGALSERLSGVINFYGRINFPRSEKKPFLPIELTRLIDVPYLGAFAGTDELIPPEDLQRLSDDLSHNPEVKIDIYRDAEHAFFNNHRETFNQEAADKAWVSVLQFLEKNS